MRGFGETQSGHKVGVSLLLCVPGGRPTELRRTVEPEAPQLWSGSGPTCPGTQQEAYLCVPLEAIPQTSVLALGPD